MSCTNIFISRIHTLLSGGAVEVVRDEEEWHSPLDPSIDFTSTRCGLQTYTSRWNWPTFVIYCSTCWFFDCVSGFLVDANLYTQADAVRYSDRREPSSESNDSTIYSYLVSPASPARPGTPADWHAMQLERKQQPRANKPLPNRWWWWLLVCMVFVLLKRVKIKHTLSGFWVHFLK